MLIADLQAMTDNASDPAKVARNVLEMALDYLAVGIDPALTTICVQSALPALAEMTLLSLNYVSVARLERNPTVKEEIRARGFERDVPAGFLCYPVAQAADIIGFAATLVPVGADQLPMIEQTNELVRRINRQAGDSVLAEAEAMLSVAPRLPGIDGQGKMSKSAGNAIALAATPDEIRAAVRAMFTDPGHLRATDPGRVDGNVVFAYLDALDPDQAEVEELKGAYRCGGVGDAVIKRRLEDLLQALLEPIRARRTQLVRDRGYVVEMLRAGSGVAHAVTQQTLRRVRDGLGLTSFA